MEHEFFGRKSKFGIELEIHDSLKKLGKARFWINEKQVGEFKVKHKLSYLKSGLRALLQNENQLWDDRFEGKNPEEIATMCWMIGKDLIWMPENEANEAAQFLKFSLYFGEQFDSACILVYKQNNKFHFIWTKTQEQLSTKIDYLKHLDFESTESEFLKQVIERFFKWFDSSTN